jgi:hypothetical protein
VGKDGKQRGEVDPLAEGSPGGGRSNNQIIK